MRVSDSMRIDSMERLMTLSRERYDRASVVASTGQRVNNPSDDPLAAAKLVRMQAQINQTDTYRNSIKNALPDLELAEGTLASSVDVFMRAKEIALQGASGTFSASDRLMLATEVRNLQQQIVALANQKGQSGYIFSGTQVNTPPLLANGVVDPTIDRLPRVIEVAAGVNAQINLTVDAYNATPSGGRDVYADLGTLYADLMSGNPVQGTTLDAVDAAMEQLVGARADAGLRMLRLDTSDAAHELADTTLNVERSHLGDANPMESYSELQVLRNTLEQSTTVAKMTLDMLRMQRF